MLVTLLTKQSYASLSLPEKIAGKFVIKSIDTSDPVENLIIEGINGKWLLKLDRKISLLEDVSKTKTVELKEERIYVLYNNSEKKQFWLYTENDTNGRQVYSKRVVNGDIRKISIGRLPENDIVYENNFVSGTHAEILYKEGSWQIRDCNSTNGTFVNQRRIVRSSLRLGDVVFLMGLKIIIGKDFIAVNNPDGKVSFSKDSFLDFEKQKAEELDLEDYEVPPTDYFYRAPRFKRDIESATFKIDSPPQSPVGEEMPLMLVIGPSMTMGMASMTTAIFAINNAITNGNISSALPSIVMSFSMLLGTVMWPIITKRYEKKRKLEKEKKRQKLYREYLKYIEEEFAKESSKQADILRENHIQISKCIDRIENKSINLWERNIGQNDFLSLRVGLGETRLEAQITYSERRFSVEKDDLQEAMYSLCESPKTIKDVPINISFYENFISGIIGERKLIKNFATGLVFQLSALYGYDNLKLVFIYDESENEDFEYVKWLPHVWDDEHKIRFIATNSSEVKELSSYFEKIIENRSEISENDIADITPYYVVFALDKKLSLKAEFLKKLYLNKSNIQFSVITFFDELKNVPKECSVVVELKKDSSDNFTGKIFDKDDISGQHISFSPDIFVKKDSRLLSTKLSNVYLDTSSGTFNLPSTVTFLQMYGVGKVEHLNAALRWKENNPTKSLEAPIGIDTIGECFKLDLHEKFHGPHGLVAGMTGSGKSEFIITYILSMAVNYHPHEVAFILIDYKGGGMAKAFENLPHTAGIITNLDGAAVNRSLISIQSELKRRQAIFADVSKAVGVSNIDIYKYQQLYREGKVVEPLQHLFIVSDEFAELKTQQPEFMAQLISAARIGRSLGVHLILATQKPAGVVDDQIWSNSKFRVCLKVQERSDSMDMIKRPDAAELSHTGRFYLQVGYNELFELGQSAWAGAVYYPSDRVVAEKDDSVAVIDKNGHIIKQARIDKKRISIQTPNKQLDEITKYLQNIAKEEKIEIRPLWLEPIPANIYLDELETKYPENRAEPYVLSPVIGEYDAPATQSQHLLRLPLSSAGNAIIFGSTGSGKTTFVTTMVYSLLKEHTPEEVNIYILDFASETMTAFSKAPHIGEVILSYEEEKVGNLFKMLRKELLKRKRMFSDYGGDYRAYIEGCSDKVPSIVVVINNFAAFAETYEERVEAIIYLSREGAKYGIYFVLTANGMSGLRMSLLQNFSQQLSLQMNDNTDYLNIVGKTNGLYPAKHKGRGLVKLDAVYEFQTAEISDTTALFKYILSETERFASIYDGVVAKRVPILPEIVDKNFIAGYIKKRSFDIPVGVNSQTLEIQNYNFGSRYINFVVSSGNACDNFVLELSELINAESEIETTLIDSQKNYADIVPTVRCVCSSVEIDQVVNEMYDVVLNRNNAYKEALERGEKAPVFEHKVYVINSLSSLLSMLEGEQKEKLLLALYHGESTYNLSVIVAEQSKFISGFTHEKWFKKHVEQNSCVYIGNGFAQQYSFKPNKITRDMQDEIGDDFGYALINGKAIRMKILNSKEAED